MKSICKRRKGDKQKMPDAVLTAKSYLILENIVKRFFSYNKHIVFNEDFVDTFNLAAQMGFDVRKGSFQNKEDDLKTEGILLVDETQKTVPQFSTNKGIGLNIRNSAETNRFTIAHELSHYIFQKYVNDFSDAPIIMAEKRITHDSEKKRGKYEQAIDYMAASILMPSSKFAKQYNDLKKLELNESEIIDDLAIQYNVSRLAVSKRILEVSAING